MITYRTPYTFDPTTVVDDTDYSEVVTIPNQSPPLSEILYRFMDGQDVSMYLRNAYDNDDVEDDDDFSDNEEDRPGFDLADVPAVISQVTEASKHKITESDEKQA